MEKKTILIADDNAIVRKAWSFVLNKDPRFSVIAECDNGEDAVEQAKKLIPNIVIIDINLPKMTGIEATKKIHENAPDTRILGVSMHAEPVYSQQMLENGAMGYLTKTSPIAEMFQAISEIIKGNQYLCNEVKKVTP
jgi:two-component system invasion response regulator UvrY